MENYSVRNTGTKNYTININSMVYQKIMHWIDKATGEVSGLGKLTVDKNTGIIDIKSAILLKQQNTGSTTDIDAQAIGKAMFELRESEGHLNFWWHSHVNMGVFWSGTDMDTIHQIGEQGFVVATVFNKKREMLSCLYKKSGDDMFLDTFINEIETKIVDYIDPAIVAEWDRDFDEKCEVKKFERYQPYSPHEGYDHYSSWYKQYGKNRVAPISDDIPNVEDEDVHYTDMAKEYAILPELNVLKDQMESQDSEGKARHILHKICNRINVAKFRNDKISYSIKKRYINAFNDKFPGKQEVATNAQT